MGRRLTGSRVFAAAALFCGVVLAGCASVDVIGAYRLSRQDYKSVDPALWRAAALYPDGVELRVLTITMSDDDETQAEFRFDPASGSRSARGLPKPKSGQALELYGLASDALEDARAAQRVWAQDDRDEDLNFSVEVAFSMSDAFSAEWCAGDAKLLAPVWIRIEPEAAYRRVLRPDAVEKLFSAGREQLCADVE